MKKSLIALAVAGAFAAPAFAATSNIDISGKVSFDVTNVSGAGTGNNAVRMNDNNTSITIKGTEDMGGGLKAGFSLTYGLTGTVGSQTGVANGDTFAGQNQVLTLGGDFGTVVMGATDNLVKGIGRTVDLFADQSNGDARYMTYRADTANSLIDARANNVLAYVSPSFGGVTVALGRSMDENTTANTADIDMATVSYTNGPIYAAVGYYTANYQAADEEGVRLGVGYTMGDLKLVALYQTVDAAGGTLNNDFKTWGVGAAYAMGPMTFKAQYYSLSDETPGSTQEDAKMYALGMDYAMSKRTTVQLVYSKVKNEAGVGYGAAAVVGGSDTITVTDGRDPSRLSVGIRHTF